MTNLHYKFLKNRRFIKEFLKDNRAEAQIFKKMSYSYAALSDRRKADRRSESKDVLLEIKELRMMAAQLN